MNSEWSAAAKRGILMLPVCPACSAVQYPPREVCVKCLEGNLEWREVDTRGEVLATTVQHYSLDERFRSQLPIHVASVRLDEGPVAIVFAEPTLKPGQRVSVKLRETGTGKPALFAVPAIAGAAGPPGKSA